MEHVTRVRPIKVSPPKEGLDALLSKDSENKESLQKMPDAHHYYAIPERKPHLRSFVHSFEWNCVTKEIEILIDETPAFSAYDWISGINENKEECLTLVLMDQLEREVSRIRFVNLELTGHRCGLTTSESDGEFGLDENEFKPLRHMLFLKYESSEFNNKTADVDRSNESDPDQEWSVTDLRIKVEDKVDN